MRATLRLLLLTLLSALSLAPTLNAIAQPRYIITDLGTLPGDYESHAFAINNKGQVAGSSTGEVGPQALLYTGGKMRGLGTLGGASSLAFGINNKGAVVGQSAYQNTSEIHGFVYDGGPLVNLGYFPGGLTASYAFSINDAGLVV